VTAGGTICTAAEAYAVASSVVDPELPMLTIAELGILRDVRLAAGRVEVDITPTYSGCPALEAIRDDVEAALRKAGAADVRVRTVLHPPWTADLISPEGCRKLAEHGVAPPSSSPEHRGHRQHREHPSPSGSVLVELSVRCPRCGSPDTRETSRFGPTPCTSLRSCRACAEPFEHVKSL
jgi:ring-1,2-phenylacetyl-CoA epoxidase subunit PaaD